MHRPVARPVASVPLHFRPVEEHRAPDVPVRNNLSAIETVGRCLFVGQDEGARIERLVTRDGTSFREHTPFFLSDIFDLPAGPDGEADIEGLALDDGYLWVAGSHSLARKKPKPDEDDAAESLARLTEVKRDANRCLLGRIPLKPAGEDGVFDLVREHDGRTAACIRMGSKRSDLAKLLKDDDHIGRFMKVPAKENGFDVEGLAARGDRLFLGLRGPVLRGWACILELTVAEDAPGRLTPVPIGAGRLPYHKHFLDLDGLGIRELTFDGDDLLVLAGPTMDLDGPLTVWRWTGCLEATEQQVIARDRLSRVLDLPHGIGFDHAEGMAHLAMPSAPERLLIVYDNPGAGRRHSDGGGVDADAFELPAVLPTEPSGGR